ncbi:uncharacterized protein [Ambystoma mexicanum]|uniref:uncharacterized protein n=1 Tax=Ambystoma mexicanum TaxID=8296 RepID=UPI0037E9359E
MSACQCPCCGDPRCPARPMMESRPHSRRLHSHPSPPRSIIHSLEAAPVKRAANMYPSTPDTDKAQLSMGRSDSATVYGQGDEEVSEKEKQTEEDGLQMEARERDKGRPPRTIRKPRRWIEEMGYKSNQEQFITESRTTVEQKTYSAVRRSSNIRKAQANATDATVHALKISLTNSVSVLEKRTHCSSILSTHSEHSANPVYGSSALYQTRNKSTEYVPEEVNRQTQHEESPVTEVAEDDYSTGTLSECSEENSSSGEFEPQHSEVGSKDGNILSLEKELCNKCCKLYQKISKDPSSSIKEPDIVGKYTFMQAAYTKLKPLLNFKLYACLF